MTQPEEYLFDTIVVRYGAVTVRNGETFPVAGTVRFELTSPRRLTTYGIDVTPEPEVGYIGEDGSLRRDNRDGEEGVLLMCASEDLGVDRLTYRATFDLTDGLGRGQINRKPVTFTVTDEDIELGEL
ncbi:hypothetical protein SAMN04488581_2597 [Mycolicibacterium neoaurum]|uniref:hypothetical protein n=1 Tax=Mycolicibacterium neoaurum TaxID=1795 RepID=UPI000561B935|nr:hypothetical protein [Mycolicibacterium neoaurum]SDD58480.1 hypothetical protein SAMN04488581_2597 [Mycolicibacterium neoaurum]